MERVVKGNVELVLTWRVKRSYACGSYSSGGENTLAWRGGVVYFGASLETQKRTGQSGATGLVR